MAQAFKVILSYTGQLGPQETRAKWSGSREASQLRTQLTANLPIAISTLLARELSQSKFNCQGFRVRLLRGYPTNLTGFFTGEVSSHKEQERVSYLLQSVYTGLMAPSNTISGETQAGCRIEGGLVCRDDSFISYFLCSAQTVQPCVATASKPVGGKSLAAEAVL